jgi:hypothetical protein
VAGVPKADSERKYRGYVLIRTLLEEECDSGLCTNPRYITVLIGMDIETCADMRSQLLVDWLFTRTATAQAGTEVSKMAALTVIRAQRKLYIPLRSATVT